LRQWAKEQLGLEAARLSACRSYANWGGTFNTSLPLPLEAQWLPERINNKQCLIPLVAVQVFANGAVSFCPCCDYNAQPALALGNVKEQTLLDIFNGPENRALWHWEADGLVPDYCRRCTFHVPLESLPQQEYVFQNPFQFIGG
jgi:radical SAM protein with 4Fe4S-binding SPASM domain